METGAYSIIKFINDFERINKPFVLKNFYLNKDKNYKLKDEEGYTPLHWACFLNDIEAVNFLLEKADIDINCKSNKGFTPLHKAVLGNNPNIVIMLLKKGADVVSVNDKNESALDLVKIINEKNNRNKDILEKYKRIKSECNNQNKKQMNLNIDYPDKTKERNKENNLNFNQLNNVNNKNNNLVIENEPDEKKLIIGENKTNNKSKNNILYNPKNVNEEIIIKDNICQIKEENKEIIKKEENTKSIENTKNIKKEKILETGDKLINIEENINIDVEKNKENNEENDGLLRNFKFNNKTKPNKNDEINIKNNLKVSLINEESKVDEKDKRIKNKQIQINPEEIEFQKKNIKNDKIPLYLSKLEAKGLINIGGTCFMNTVLQCFFHVTELTDFFIKQRNVFEDKDFSNSYSSVVDGLINSNENAFKPIKFKRALINIDQKYGSFNGCDPKDVVEEFLCTVHSELNDDASVKLNNKLNKLNKIEVFKYYKDQEEKTKTIISELFSWCCEREKYCPDCGNKTYDFDFDNVLIFYLEKVYKELKANFFSQKKLDLINDCFKYRFMNRKKQFHCFYCDESKNGDVTEILYELPKYFIIVLDRGKDDKFQCDVNFEIDIDLSSYTEQTYEKNYSTKYSLLCATFLQGHSGCGHTVAFCKHFDNNYYLFNDSSVSKENRNYIKNKNAFLLFYERK